MATNARVQSARPPSKLTTQSLAAERAAEAELAAEECLAQVEEALRRGLARAVSDLD